MSNVTQKRILALDVRPRSFGFVVFEGPERLLDWGARTFAKGVHVVRVPPQVKFASMFSDFSPEAIVVNQRVFGNPPKKSRLARIALAVAQKRKIPVKTVSRSAVKRSFPEHRNKHETARMLARRFPELEAVLPPKRKCWQSEDYRMSIFDAVGLGVAYFSRGKSIEPPPPASPPDPSQHP